MRQQQELVKYDLQMPSVIAVKDPGSSVIGVECDPLAFEPRSVADLNRARSRSTHADMSSRANSLPMTTFTLGIVLLGGAMGLVAFELGGRLSIPGVHGIVSTAEAVVGRPLTPVSGARGVRRDAARPVFITADRDASR